MKTNWENSGGIMVPKLMKRYKEKLGKNGPLFTILNCKDSSQILKRAGKALLRTLFPILHYSADNFCNAKGGRRGRSSSQACPRCLLLPVGRGVAGFAHYYPVLRSSRTAAWCTFWQCLQVIICAVHVFDTGCLTHNCILLFATLRECSELPTR